MGKACMACKPAGWCRQANRDKGSLGQRCGDESLLKQRHALVVGRLRQGRDKARLSSCAAAPAAQQIPAPSALDLNWLQYTHGRTMHNSNTAGRSAQRGRRQHSTACHSAACTAQHATAQHAQHSTAYLCIRLYRWIHIPRPILLYNLRRKLSTAQHSAPARLPLSQGRHPGPASSCTPSGQR